HASVKLLLIGTMTAFHLAVDLWTARRNPGWAIPRSRKCQVKSVPNSLPWSVWTRWMAIGSRWRTSSKNAIAFGNRAVCVDPQDAVAGGLIHRGELIEPSAPELEVFDVDLDGLPGHGEFAAPTRSGSIAFHRDPRHPVPFEDLVDRRDRDIDLMKAL